MYYFNVWYCASCSVDFRPRSNWNWWRNNARCWRSGSVWKKRRKNAYAVNRSLSSTGIRRHDPNSHLPLASQASIMHLSQQEYLCDIRQQEYLCGHCRLWEVTEWLPFIVPRAVILLLKHGYDVVIVGWCGSVTHCIIAWYTDCWRICSGMYFGLVNKHYRVPVPQQWKDCVDAKESHQTSVSFNTVQTEEMTVVTVNASYKWIVMLWMGLGLHYGGWQNWKRTSYLPNWITVWLVMLLCWLWKCTTKYIAG